jgi:uncharacterized membrane protein YqjE
MSTVTRNSGNEDLKYRPLGDLFKQLATDSSTLLRKEIELARVEMIEKGKRFGVGVGMCAAAALLAFLVAGVLTIAFVAALATSMSTWLASLIVAVVYVAAGAILAWLGIQQIKRSAPPVPEKAVDEMQEDLKWARAQMK